MSRRRPSATVLSLLGLGLGFGGGLVAYGLHLTPLLAAARFLAPLGTLWTNALQMTVIPLVLVNLLLAVAGGADGRAVGRLGGLSLAVFLLLLLAGGLLAALAVPPLLAFVPVGAMSLAAPGAAGAAAAAGAATAAGAAPPGFADWLVGLVPVNPFGAAAGGQILPLIVFTLLFALGLTRVRTELRRPLIDGVRAASEAIFAVLRWILWFTPVGVFCLTFVLSARMGPASAGAVGIFIALVSGLLIGSTLLLYPFAAALGRVPVGRFARGVAPAQVVAVSTRSSLAALPSLVLGAERHLRLPAPVVGFVLPLAVATFKVNRTVSSTAKLLFLAHVYGIPLEPGQIGTFIATVLLLSFMTPGIPSTGGLATLPVYLSFGLPVEGVVILGAVDAAPDIFKTLANVTADMAAAVVVARHSGRSGASAEPAAAASAATGA